MSELDEEAWYYSGEAGIAHRWMRYGAEYDSICGLKRRREMRVLKPIAEMAMRRCKVCVRILQCR